MKAIFLSFLFLGVAGAAICQDTAGGLHKFYNIKSGRIAFTSLDDFNMGTKTLIFDDWGVDASGNYARRRVSPALFTSITGKEKKRKLGEDTVLGRKCEVFDEEETAKVWFWNGLALRTELKEKLAGSAMGEVAVVIVL